MIVGHKKQINLLENILKSGVISQAYLFVGPESIGKFSIAKIFADSLNKGEKKARWEVIENNRNPNVDILEPEVTDKKGVLKTKNIEIDSIRRAQRNLSLYPLSGVFRILIVDNAHELTASSQNALLKILEEPNETSIIILVTHKEGSILDTIKSRCQKVNFNLVALNDIKIGFRNKMADKKLEKMSIFSMGRPGEANEMIGNDYSLREKEAFINILREMSSMNIARRFELAEEYSKNIPQTISILEFWIWFLRIQIFKGINDDIKTKKYYVLIKKLDSVLVKLRNPSFSGRLILENLFLNL